MSWLQIVLGIISLAKWMTTTLHDNKTFAAGQTKAVADALTAASAEVSKALAAGAVAEKKARDGEFDPELFRKD